MGLINKRIPGGFFILALLTLACKASEKSVTQVKVFASLPIYNEQIVRNDTAYEDVFYYKDIQMYKMPIQNVYSRNFYNSKSDSIIQQVDSIALSYFYVIRNNKDSIGIRYDSLPPYKKRVVNIDSFLSRNFELNYNSIYQQTKSLYKSIKIDKNDNEVIERLIPIKKIDETFSDTDYYFFRKDYNDIKFSFSPEVDTRHKMKLYKIVSSYNGNPLSNESYFQQTRQISIWFDKVKPEKEEEEKIAHLFQQFINDYKIYSK